MTNRNTVPEQPLHSVSFATPIIIGAGIALVLISIFVSGVDTPHPDWGKYWMIRPLIITPIAGAMGGAFFAFMLYLSSRGFNTTLAVILGFLVYLVGLWLGSVLGLAGTLWN